VILVHTDDLIELSLDTRVLSISFENIVNYKGIIDQQHTSNKSQNIPKKVELQQDVVDVILPVDEHTFFLYELQAWSSVKGRVAC
jgi:hypothetical protein